MELSEAKKILKEEIWRCTKFEDSRKRIAIEIILKALDNSISKEYHEMVIKEQNDIIEDLKSQLNNCYTNEQHDMIVKALNDMIEFLKKQLENSISKDEVRKLSNDAFEVNTHEYGTLFVVPYDNIQELLGEE